MRDYELVYILNPDLSEEAVGDLMTRFQTLASSQGADIQSQERWEKRRLAYEIKDKREGIYVVMELNAPPEAIHEMERILRITEGVLRHMVVRAEDLKGSAAKVREQMMQPQPQYAPPRPAAPAEETPVQASETETAATDETPSADAESDASAGEDAGVSDEEAVEEETPPAPSSDEDSASV